MKLTVVIPVKNEPYASVVVEQIHNHLSEITHEILVQRENGYANAVWHGFQRAKGQFIAVMDADGSHRVTDLSTMLTLLLSHPEINLVLAQRKWLHHPLFRKIVSLSLAWLTRNMLGLPFNDPLSTFMVGKQEVMRFNDSRSSKFTLEILKHVDLATVMAYDVVNEPRKEGKSKNKPVEAVRLLKQLLRLKRR